jgi:hypothetical protein
MLTQTLRIRYCLSVSEYEFIVITTLLLSFHIIAPCHGKIVGSIAMIIPGFDTWPHVCFADCIMLEDQDWSRPLLETWCSPECTTLVRPTEKTVQASSVQAEFSNIFSLVRVLSLYNESGDVQVHSPALNRLMLSPSLQH